jgi:hypothetical protein
MALKDKLHALDHSFFPGTRDDEEDAETYLRRVAASRAISPAQIGDVMTALREYLGVEPQGAAPAEGEDESNSEETDESAGNETDESEDAGEEKDESDDKEE